MINIAIKLATSITYTADGSQTNFSIPFDYLRPSFVHVAVNDAEVSEGFTVSNRGIMFDTAPAKAALVKIYRKTPTSRLVSWADASILKAIDMTIAEVQQLHILEEASDWSKTNSIVLDEEGNTWQGRNCRMSNIADPTEAQDVVTKNYLENTEDSFVQRMNAIKTQTEQFANTAGNSKDSAYKSAQSASVSAASAAESAKLAEGYKNIAETAKSNASLYAANAKTSADNAGASKEAAQSAATTASNFASDAKNSASEAKTYKDNAKIYMDNAKNYSENVNVFLPSVSTEGVLSWTNKAGLTNPASVNIKGAKGDTGAAATITIGSITTGAAGSNASVTNSGTASNVVLDFTLPRGNDGKDGGITVDAELNDTSTNPIQNKAVNTAISTVKNNMTQGFQTVTASIPTKVSTLENDAGYLTQHQSLAGYAKTSVTNTWTVQQDFYDLMLNREKYTTYAVIGTSDTPITSTIVYNVTGAFTLNLATLAKALSANQSSVFTAYFAANGDYSLTISNAGQLKYTGSASDVAITRAGLLLNIMMLKDDIGVLTSIVQASKLEGGA
nr:MAG TPA: tail fiber protein [Bacteriophage sp.]